MSDARPLPFHTEVRDHLKAHEAGLWSWFSSADHLRKYAENIRIEILKGAYRLDRATHAVPYAAADGVAAKLGIGAPVTLYQSQLSTSLNAAMLFLPGEMHLVLSGPLADTLSPPEFEWILGHEMAHFRFLERDGGEFHVADQILQAMAADRRAETSHLETHRVFQLYTEVLADRVASAVQPDPLVGVSALVKLQTGLREVNAKGYLDQAAEILSKGPFKTEELSHPEAFLRARALQLWSERGEAADAEIARLIEGPAALDELTLPGQRRLTDLTRRTLAHYFSPAGLRGDGLLAHARLFFDDFVPPAAGTAPKLENQAGADESIRRYLCYLLLDFAAADPELTDAALAAGLETARALGLEDEFAAIAAKELKIKKKAFDKLRESAPGILARLRGTP